MSSRSRNSKTALPRSPRVQGEKIAFRIGELRPSVKPFRLHWFPTLRSTNDHAIALRNRDELFAPAIVLTGRQTGGRGRGSNTWWSGPGSLTATFALPVSEHVEPQQLPLVAGLAVRDALSTFCDDPNCVQLKWPNDLLISGRKLAGLLCERVRKVDLIGIGVNVNFRRSAVPKALRDTIAVLSESATAPPSMNDVVTAISEQLLQRLLYPGRFHFATLLREYESHHALFGKRVRVDNASDHHSLIGKSVGLDEVGRLLVRDRRATHAVIAGSVRVL